MTRKLKTSLSALAIAGLLASGLAFETTPFAAQPAFAGNGNGNNGNGNGNSGGSNGRGNSGNAGGNGNGNGAIASELGGLNAAHANANAFANASANSAVGRVAIYRDAIAATADAAAVLDGAIGAYAGDGTALLESLVVGLTAEPPRDSAAIEAEILALSLLPIEEQPATYDADLAQLTSELEILSAYETLVVAGTSEAEAYETMLGGDDPLSEEALAALREMLSE